MDTRSHSLEDISHNSIPSEQIQKEFNDLEKQFNNNPSYYQLLYKCTEQEKKFNRYQGLIPYSFNRITSKQGDYLNASQIKLLSGHSLIAAQAPKPPFDTFWDVIVEKQVDLVVMLCPCQAGNHKQADRYWPSQEKSKQSINSTQYKVELISQKTLRDQFQQRLLSVSSTNSPAETVRQLHWSGWQDFGAPSQESMDIVKRIVEQVFIQFQSKKQALIHCSAGIGRTGTMTSVLDVVGLVKGGRKDVSVFKVVENLRKQRFQSVEKEIQYKFIFQFLAYYLANLS